MTKNGLLPERVAEVYDWLSEQIRACGESAGCCGGCGKCCDFEKYDHCLFVTPPELMYLAVNLGVEKLEPTPTSLCPYNVEGKCTVYDYRFAACRIFCCSGDEDFQAGLSESTLAKLKAICMDFQIAYRYADLRAALNDPEAQASPKPI